MKLLTARLGSVHDPELIDITVMSAATQIGKLLAPTWKLVGGIKKWQAEHTPDGHTIELNDYFSNAAPISWDEYVEQYTHLLRVRYHDNPLPFQTIIKAERRVLACYCTDTSCCHRTLAAGVLQKIAAHCGVDLEYLGEMIIQKELM